MSLHDDTDDMSLQEKLEYINTALDNLRKFLLADEPERHAVLLTHDNVNGEMHTYSFNADAATSLFMLTSAAEGIREDLMDETIQRSLN